MSAGGGDVRRAVTVCALLALVLGGATLTWGSVPVSLANPLGAILSEERGVGFTPHARMSLDGWNGTVTLVGVELPNVLVPCAGVLLALLLWVEGQPHWRVPRVVSLLLAAYAVLHVVAVASALHEHDGALGAGLLLSGAAAVVFLVAARRGPRSPATEG